MTLFFKDLTERALKTFAQSLLGTLGAGATDLLSVNWVNVLSIAGLATVISILTSMGSLTVGEDTASLIKTGKEAQSNGDQSTLQ